jgi:hypothetical protein
MLSTGQNLETIDTEALKAQRAAQIITNQTTYPFQSSAKASIPSDQNKAPTKTKENVKAEKNLVQKLEPIFEDKVLEVRQVVQKITRQITSLLNPSTTTPISSDRIKDHREDTETVRKEHLKYFWLKTLKSKEVFYFKIIEALERNLIQLAISFLDAPVLPEIPIWSDDRGPNLYSIFFEAIKCDQKTFVDEAVKRFINSKEFKKEPLECSRSEPKLILLVCSILQDDFNTFGKLLCDKNFKIDENHKNDFINFLKFLSKYTDYLPMVLNSRLSEFISPDDLSTLLLLNVLYQHMTSIESLLNSSQEIPTVAISNALNIAFDLQDASIFDAFEKSKYHKKSQKFNSELVSKLGKASKDDIEKMFMDAVDSKNSRMLETFSTSTFIPNTTPQILAEALIKTASTPNDRFTSSFTESFFIYRLMTFTVYVRIPIDRNGWGGALVQASKNGYEGIVKKILDSFQESNYVLNDCDTEEALAEAKKNGYQIIEKSLREYINS